MEQENPYLSPTIPADETQSAKALGQEVRLPGISPANTIGPRYIAANIDGLFAAVCMLIALKANPLDYRFLHIAVAILAVLAYYFISESLFSRTPGKFLMGLVVRKFDGGKCGWREAAIRTAFRVLEVNPLLFGALPGSVLILISRNRQRLGDKVADTVVVLARRVR